MESKVAPKATVGDWEGSLGKPAPVCEQCQQAFAPQSTFVNRLYFEGGRPLRRVVCESCHAQEHPAPFAFWRSKVSGPESGKPRPLDLAFLIELFQRLHAETESGTGSHDEIRYIVTLLLLRKRVLVQLGQEKEGEGDEARELLLTRFAREKEGETFRTPIPDLTAERMEAIRDDLGRIFNLEEKKGADGAS